MVFNLFKYGSQKTSYKKQRFYEKETNKGEQKNLIFFIDDQMCYKGARCQTLAGELNNENMNSM